jgi:ABC-type cobalamin/Fe3+-siderophores transport system ATPase subunit
MDEATNQLNTELEIKILQYLEKKVLQNKLTIISSFHNKIALEYASKHYSFDDHSNNF